MASDLRAIVAAIKVVLQGIDADETDGGYTYNLSDTADRVMVGALPEAPSRLQVWITDFGLRSTLEASLGRYKRTATIDIVGVVPAAVTAQVDGPTSRMYAAADLADDIHRAIEADRMVGNRVLDVTVESATLDGADIGIDGMGVAILQVTAWWFTSGGV